MRLNLEEVTRDNWQACIALRVPPQQEPYVASNVYSLAEARFHPERIPMAVYDGRTMVGLVVVSFIPDLGQGWIHRLMIDENFQRRGYSLATVKTIIRRMRRIPGCRSIGVDFHPSNETLENFYTAMGFQKTGQATPEGYIIAIRPVRLEGEVQASLAVTEIPTTSRFMTTDRPYPAETMEEMDLQPEAQIETE